ncbi:MAG: anaerobic sulfite reductase subunit AsrA [Omnitrophica bacterium]|nr:anaerobic sulfite reductase subunit AsrA [Candidatus Omnitrophota bacterium]
MKMLKITQEEAGSIFESLSQRYKIIAPVEKIGEGRFSNTSLLAYAEVKSFEEIEFFKKTERPAKEILFPVRQSLFEFKKKDIQELHEKIPPSIVFLRACDINAIGVTDAHFLNNEKFKDIYYKRRREAVKLFLMECKEPFGSCFCVSMGTNKTEDYSGFMRKLDDGYEIKVTDGELENYFSGGTPKDVEPAFVEKDKNPITIPREIDVSLFKNELWKEYSQRCSACGRCNTSCPTCACFTIQDIFSQDSNDAGQRRRVWSSCQVKNFAVLAGNHDFRVPKGDRMRYKVLHKIRDFKKLTGFNMCVGCGRCDDVCPDYISISKCIEKINKITGGNGDDG